MRLVPIFFAEACEFVRQHHRHRSTPPVGHLFSLAAAVEERIVAVAIVGRPIARMNQDGLTCELTRLASDGTPNACSFLYGRAWRAAQALGYRRMVTYTLDTESGSSLRAAGFRLVGDVSPRSWDCPSRPRVDLYPLQAKFAWEKTTEDSHA